MPMRGGSSHPHEVRGDGEPVLVIGGFGVSSTVLEPLVDRWAAHLRCVTYDHPGTGRAARRAPAFTTGGLAAAALRVLDDAGLESAYVAGLSLGGAVALELALRHPGRVRGLVLMATSATGALNFPNPLTLAAAGARMVGASVSSRRPALGPLLFSSEFCAAEPERVARLLAPLTAEVPRPWTLAGQYSAAGLHDRRRALPRVRVPTLVLHGDEDILVPVRNARRLASAIPHAELHLFPGTGHGFMFERPEETCAVLVDWVERQRSATSSR